MLARRLDRATSYRSVPGSSSSAVLLREELLPRHCSMVCTETTCCSTMPLWRRRWMHGSVSVPRVSHVANLRFAAWAWCFGPETSRLRLAAWRSRARLPLWQDSMPRDRAQAPRAVSQHALSYSWTPGRRATPTTSLVQSIPRCPSLIRLGTEPCSGLPPELQKPETTTTT
jgi:hypothetical protein